MILFGKQLTKNYGLEIALFHHLRQFSNGLTMMIKGTAPGAVQCRIP
jgi:hypothetical protein